MDFFQKKIIGCLVSRTSPFELVWLMTFRYRINPGSISTRLIYTNKTLQEFLDVKPQTRNCIKQEKIRKQSKNARKLNFNLFICSRSNLATFSCNTDPLHLLSTQKFDVRIICCLSNLFIPTAVTMIALQELHSDPHRDAAVAQWHGSGWPRRLLFLADELVREK